MGRNDVQVEDNAPGNVSPRSDPGTGEVLDHKGRRLDEFGREVPDPSSLAPPVGFIAQPPLHELIRQMVRSEQLRQEAEALDAGSFDDEDDFDVEDDEEEYSSPWEENFDPQPVSGGVGEAPAPAPEAQPTPGEPPKEG